MSRVKLAVLGCIVVACSVDRVEAILALSGDPVRGARLFSDHCAGCHDADGSGGSAPDVRGLDAATVALNMLAGPGEMTDFSDLPDADIADITAHVEAL